ncbi:MAG: UDP-N-acetylmuramate dehydrogenase [Alphaproteobacteria bacterium]|nr:UDP-N-acetylmuramate dehydrogenase [Alphaproteobacteria bacterium]
MLPKQKPVRDLLEYAPIGRESWFGCGGVAERLLEPASISELQAFLRSSFFPSPYTLIGGLANTIVRDGGVKGLTIRLGKGCDSIHVLDETTLEIEAGALNGSVAAAALKAGIAGLEFLSGIPGRIGGAVAMNAGAYGTEMKDVLVSVQGMTTQGQEWNGVPAMSYRHTDLPEDTIVTSVILRGVKENYETIKARMNEIKTKRNATQPIKEHTGGSTFANPLDEDLIQAGLEPGLRAWQIVERVGGRGLKIGGAMMSEQHCNFMINTGNACAADLENLGEEIRKRVLDQCGLDLRWEIKRIGVSL